MIFVYKMFFYPKLYISTISTFSQQPSNFSNFSFNFAFMLINSTKFKIDLQPTIHYSFDITKIHTTIWIWKSLQKFAFLCFTKKKFHYNYKKISCSMEMKSNNKIKSIVYQKQNLWFSTTKYLQLFLLPKTTWRALKFLVRPKKGPTTLKSESNWNLVSFPASSIKTGERGMLKVLGLD